MFKKAAVIFALAISALVVAPATSQAFPACDSFGQDWTILVGAFGATYPGTLVVSGTRDTNSSLGCGHALALDGTAVIVAPANVIWSMAAYDSPADSCVSTFWRGNMPISTLVVTGHVSNEAGPFGTFTLRIGATTCREASDDGRDPNVN
jgi:hypothetical protein